MDTRIPGPSAPRRAARILGVALAALCLFGTLGASRAEAGQYAVWQCDASRNPTVDFSRVVFQNGGNDAAHMKSFVSCGTGVGMGVFEEGATTKNGAWGAWNFSAPPTAYFARVELQEDSGGQNGFGPYGVIWPIGGGSSVFNAVNNWNWTGRSFTGLSAISFFLQCSRQGGCTKGSAHNHVRNLIFTVREDAPASLSLSGSVLEPGPQRGSHIISAHTGDAGSGVRRVAAAVNGILVHDQTLECSVNGHGAVAFTPCPTGPTVGIQANTAAEPWRTGSNTLTVCAYDYAGNGPTCQTRTIEVENRCPSSTGAVASTMQAGLEQGGSVRSSAVVTSREDVIVRGRLTTASGEPVEGAKVCVYETVEIPDASAELVAMPTTQANGRFATSIESGPSRSVEIVYRNDRQQLERDASVDAVVVPDFAIAGQKQLSNGSNVRFRGALPGPNADARNVVLQARAGKKWRSFKTLRTDERGRFRGLYRFTATRGRVKYVFRALVKQQGGYPFLPGSSKKRRVRVTG